MSRSRQPGELAQAVGDPRTGAWLWVLLGVGGLLLIAGGAVIDMPGLMEGGASWWRPLITMPGYLVLLLSWWRLGPRFSRPRLVTAIWSAVLVLMPPLHSRDSYSYSAQGWLMTHGLDPYLVPSGMAGKAGLLVGRHWFRTTSVYPPLAVESFHGVAKLVGEHLLFVPMAMRLPNLVAMVVLAWTLPRLARRVGISERLALWAGLLNPLIITQWVGGIHSDAVMVAALGLAFLAAGNAAWRGYAGALAGGALIGVSMGFKQSAAVAGLGVIALAWQAGLPRIDPERRNWWGLFWRSAAGGGAAIGTFTALSLGSGRGFGWSNKTAGSPLGATSNTPLSWVASFTRYHKLLSSENVVTVFTSLSTVFILIALVWLVSRYGPKPPDDPGRPWVIATGALLAFAALGPALQPWYLTWALPFVVFCRPALFSQQLWLVTVCAAATIPTLQDFLAPYTSMFILVIPVWLFWNRVRRDSEPIFPAPQATSSAGR